MATNGETEPGTTETQIISKNRRRKSIVWDYFTVETVGDNCRRACCKKCKQTFAYSSGSKVAGTSHLKRHLALEVCPKNRPDKKKKQITTYASNIKSEGESTDPPKRRYRSIILAFDQERSRFDLAKMIILHEYPLHMVEHLGFKAFVENLQPQFRIEAYDVIESECLAIYEREKQKVIRLLALNPGRINLSLELFSNHSTRYVSITGSFIGNDWNLHRRVLNFMTVTSPHAENALVDAIAVCLLEWNLEAKLFTITLDGYSSDNIMGAYLRGYLSNKNVFVLNSQSFLIRCFANILGIVAQDGMKAIHDAIDKVREIIKFVRETKSNEEKFNEIVQELQLAIDFRNVALDIPTQWDTTYFMISSSLELKEAFSCLDQNDLNYECGLTIDDWKRIEELCNYLKVLHEVASVLSGSPCATSNIFFHHAWKIQLDFTDAVNKPDVQMNIIKPMHERFDKYWKESYLIFAIAVIMDPRFKMKLVEFNFSKLYGEDASIHVKRISEVISELYLDYIPKPLALTAATTEEVITTNDSETEAQIGANNSNSDGLLDFDIYISEISNNQQTKSELDQYLEEALHPRIQEFDLLHWWNLNILKYPTLSLMARDILSIPMSLAPLNSIFDIGDKVLDPYKGSLPPTTVEALVCAKDWLQHSTPEFSKAIVKFEP